LSSHVPEYLSARLRPRAPEDAVHDGRAVIDDRSDLLAVDQLPTVVLL
jgi:hypothetical protein